MRFNPSLQLALDFVQKTNRHIFLTGKAGTGKTTFLHYLREHVHKRMVVVAPTGVAAINARGLTIHSFFQMPFGPILPQSLGDSRQLFGRKGADKTYTMKFAKRKIDIIKSMDLLVIDEISMVRADLLDGIDQVLRRYRDRSKAFGGVQVLMVGDPQQLSPIVKPEEWQMLSPYYQHPFFFGSKVYAQANAVQIELTEVFRQTHQSFVDILNAFRDNRVTKGDLERLNARYLPQFKDEKKEYITLTTHNATADDINETALAELNGRTYTYHAKVDGVFPEYMYPMAEELQLKVGAQVMFVKNDSSGEKKYYNGKIGVVTALESKKVYVRSEGEAHDIEVDTEMWENINYAYDKKTQEVEEEVVGSFKHIPLRLAWAITVHKSQGLTFDKAIIDVGRSFAHGQTYVALSRCKTLEGLVLKQPVSQSAVIQDQRVSHFNAQVEQHTPKQSDLELSKINYEIDVMAALYHMGPLDWQSRKCQHVLALYRNIILGNLEPYLQHIMEEGLYLNKVGQQFVQQLRQLSQTEGLPTQSTLIQQRLQKSQAFFLERLAQLYDEHIAKLHFETDNSAVKKELEEAIQQLSTFAYQKVWLFQQLSEAPVGVAGYLKLRLQAEEQKPRRSQPAAAVGEVENMELFEALKALRHSIATERNIKHYQVFSQKSLVAMCAHPPRNQYALLEIHGIGKKKVEQYGAAIIDCIDQVLG